MAGSPHLCDVAGSPHFGGLAYGHVARSGPVPDSIKVSGLWGSVPCSFVWGHLVRGGSLTLYFGAYWICCGTHFASRIWAYGALSEKRLRDYAGIVVGPRLDLTSACLRNLQVCI